jgi:S1-C subfamily serine protease
MTNAAMRNRLVTALALAFLVAPVVPNAGLADEANSASVMPDDVKIAAPNPATAASAMALPSTTATSSSAATAAVAGMLGPSTIADIAQAVAPAVVFIEVDKQIPQNMANVPNSQLFNFLFNGHPIPNQLNQQGRPRMHTPSMGSGFIIRDDGYILTNAHVVTNQEKILVTLNDGRKLPGTVVGTDSFSDVAVVKINASNLPVARMGTIRNLRPGDFAIAIGSPLGFDHTVTFGIISAIGRRLHQINDHVSFIQTDAAINPGNSGGPLLNLSGDVIGINTAINATGQNIGFSIPIDTVKDVADALINHRKIERPWLGISMQPLDATVLKSIGSPESTKGIFVNAVSPGSPANAAGLEPGDILQKVDGKDVDSAEEVQKMVFSHKVNDNLHILVLRKNAAKAFACTIGQYPSAAGIKDPTQDEE